MSSSVCSLTRRAGLFVVAVFVFVFVLLWVVFFFTLNWASFCADVRSRERQNGAI